MSGLTCSAAILLAFLTLSLPEQIKFDPLPDGKGDTGYITKWDPAQERVILYRDISVPSVPAVRIFSNDGRSVPIYPLKDFPGSNYLDIWSVACAPNGGAVIAAILGYGPRTKKPIPIKSLLLTYNSTGTLTRVWDVNPYHHHHIAVDSEGNVFALGERDDLLKDYGLLVKYSTDGKVLGEFLPTSLFQSKDAVIESGSPNGESQMMITNDRLFVWLAPIQELFSLSLDGVVQSRASFSSGIVRFSAENDGARVQILNVAIASDQEIVAQVRLWPRVKTRPTALALIKFSPGGAFKGWLEAISGEGAHRFLGLTADQKMVSFEQWGQVGTINFH